MFLMSLVAVGSLVSCNSGGGDYPRYSLICTVVGGATGYYFQADDGTTSFYPADKSRVPSYAPTGGDRVYIEYNLIEAADSKVPGYTYTIALYSVQQLPDMRSVDDFDTVEELEELGDAPAAIYTDNYGNAYLGATKHVINIGVAFYANTLSKHTLSLAHVEGYEPEDKPADADGYIYFELRHDAGDDTPSPLNEPNYANWYAFSLNAFRIPADSKGVLIGVKGFDGKMQYKKADWPKAN